MEALVITKKEAVMQQEEMIQDVAETIIKKGEVVTTGRYKVCTKLTKIDLAQSIKDQSMVREVDIEEEEEDQTTDVKTDYLKILRLLRIN